MNQININGKTYNFPSGANISAKNGKVFVNGKPIFESEQPLIVEITGDVGEVVSNNTVTVKGNVLGSVEAGNSVHCGDVGRDVRAGNSVHAKKIQGNAKAGNSVKIY